MFNTHNVHEFGEAINKDELKGTSSPLCCRWRTL